MGVLEDAEARGYLVVEQADPQAGDLIRQWRRHCRARGTPSMSAACQDGQAWVEVRQSRPGKFRWDLHMLQRTAGLERVKAFTGGWGVEGNHTFSVPLEVLPPAMAGLRRLIEEGPEPQPESEKLQESQGAIRTQGVRECTVCAVGPAFALPSPPPIPLLLDDREYAVMAVALRHVWGEGPVSVLDRCGPIPTDPPGLLAIYLPRLKPDTLSSWTAHRGPYRLEDRLGSQVELGGGDDCDLCLSRPGFDGEGRQALAAVMSRSRPESSQYVMMEWGEAGWQVLDQPHDCDSEPTEFEWERIQASTLPQRWSQVPDDWKLVMATYPDSYDQTEGEAIPFSQTDWAQSDGFFRRLALGRGPPNVLERRVIPTLYDPPRTLAELLQMDEVLWGSPGLLTESLHAQGIPVIRFGSDGPRWLGKLLAHLSDHYNCPYAQIVWSVGKPVEPSAEQLLLVEEMGRALAKRGLPREVRLTDMSYPLPAYVQTEPPPLVRIQDRARDLIQELKTQPGPLVINVDYLRYVSFGPGWDQASRVSHLVNVLLKTR